MIMNNPTINAPEYFSYPGTLPDYKKGKPILTGIVALFFGMIFEVLLLGITCVVAAISCGDPLSFITSFRNGYESLDAYSAVGALFSMGSIAIAIPAIFLAMKITKERSVSTLTSSRGGWNSDFFKKALLLALVTNAIPQIIIAAAKGGFSHIDIKYTISGFIIFAALVPFQCIAEEYLFRGFIAQTLGSWFKKPAITIIVSSILFMILHGYNSFGQSAIFISGIIYCLAAYYTKGLEVGCAFHFVNNFFAFLLSGLGIEAVSSNTSIGGFIADILIDVAFLVAVVFMNKKKGWFNFDEVADKDNNAEEINVAS